MVRSTQFTIYDCQQEYILPHSARLILFLSHFRQIKSVKLVMSQFRLNFLNLHQFNLVSLFSGSDL